jgi:hypothetical protein
MNDNRKLASRMSRLVRYGVTACALTVAFAAPAGASKAPSLTLTKGPYHNGQLISLSVGPNHFFKPYSHVNVLECADPKGKAEKLPTSAATCDGNTIQSNTILVKKNGSFSEHRYELFSLPNATALGEPADNQPICNSSKMCVLYVGENQESFTAPKLFSVPFSIRNPGKRS